MSEDRNPETRFLTDGIYQGSHCSILSILERANMQHIGTMRSWLQLKIILLQARFRLRFGDFQAAIDLCKRGLKTSPNDFRILLVLQTAYEQTRNWDSYYEIFQLVLSLRPGDLGVIRNFGTALLFGCRYREALEQFTYCVDHWNLDARYSGALANTIARSGICHAYLENWDAAEQAFQNAQKLSPWDSDLVFGQVLLYRGTGHLDRIPEFLDNLIAVRGNSYDLYYWMGFYTHYLMYDPAKSLDWYKASLNRITGLRYNRQYLPYYVSSAIDASPDAVLEEYIEALVQTGRVQGILWRLFWNTLRYKSSDIDVGAIRIKIDLLRGEFGKAKQRCLKGIMTTKPAALLARRWSLLATAQGELGELDAAVDSARRGLSTDSGSFDCLTSLGLLHTKQNDWQNGAAVFRKAVELEPFDSDSWEQLGLCYLAMDNLHEARYCLEKVVKLDPLDALAWVDLGALYYRLGLWEDGRSACNRGLSYDRLSEQKRSEVLRLLEAND